MDDQSFVRLNAHDTTWSDFPEFGGHQSVLFQSADGTKMAASFRLSGRHSWVMEYDDFFYVIAGSAVVTLDKSETVTIAAGDFCRIRQGTAVTFDMTDDFHEVSVLVSDRAFDHTEHPGGATAST